MEQAILLNWMFTERFQLRRSLFQDDGSLARRCKWFGLANLVAMPFVLPLLCVYFLFKHAEEAQTKKEYLGPRKWSPWALWKFREFNELPHILDRR
jgi:autophagy-related protein 9